MITFKTFIISLILESIVFNISIGSVPKKQSQEHSDILNMLQGNWTLTEDSLAGVYIQNKKWTFLYQGKATSEDVFNINITDSLPEYVNPTIDANFIVLTNINDTIPFEIFGLNDTLLSLMSYPNGYMSVYKKK